MPVQTAEVTPPSKCDGCGKLFPSRNAIFKHLKETDGACLSGEDYKDFLRYVRKTVKPPKVILLYGYLPYKGCKSKSEIPIANKADQPIIRNGQDAGNLLMEVVNEFQNEIDGFDNDDVENNNESGNSINKVNRSYGHFSRSAECVKQDMDTGAVTEVLTMRLHPLRADMSLESWLDRVQTKLNAKFQHRGDKTMVDSDNKDRVTPVRILGRQDMPNKKFNAEMDVSLTFALTEAKNFMADQKIDWHLTILLFARYFVGHVSTS